MIVKLIQNIEIKMESQINNLETRIEKKMWFKVKNKSVFHLGKRGNEYKYNEKLKSKE